MSKTILSPEDASKLLAESGLSSLEIAKDSSSKNEVSTDGIQESPTGVSEPILENTEKDLEGALGPLKSLARPDKYKPLEFENAAEMLTFFDDNLKEGIISWYPWQLEANEFICQGIDPIDGAIYEFTKLEPLKLLLVACNGSGKDAYVITPLAIWLCLCKVRSRTIITSASYSQLESQTQSYIRTRCFQINNWCRENGIVGEEDEDVFLVKKDHIVCTLTHSEIKMFATDDPGKAEGYHPFPDYPMGEVTIIVNEGKTVKDEIFVALGKCTFNRWIVVSSAGGASGYLYNNYRRSRDWKEGYKKHEFYSRLITSYDCLSHKTVEAIEADKREYGENSFAFRTKHLSLFTSVDEQVVIALEQWNKCINFPPEPRRYKNWSLRAGLDLAKGGDENAFYVVDGNEVLGYGVFKATDTAEVTCPVLIRFFEKWELKRGVHEIYADDGGVGSAIIDWLRRDGWNVIRVLNQNPPLVKGGMYGNKGAENWFRFARLIQECLINLERVKKDDRLMSQLTSRYYKQHETLGKIILESKKEAKAKGHGSPDRADALVLAFSGLSIHDFTDGLHENVSHSAPRKIVTQESIAKMMDEKKFSVFSKKRTVVNNNPGSILRSIYNN